MVRHDVLIRRLHRLDEVLAFLSASQRWTWEEYATVPERYASVERFLQIAMEVLLDIGNHVVADENLGVVNRYRDIPEILERTGRITSEQRAAWIRMIGFRNILVHDYLDVDRRIVFDVLHHHLADIRSLRDTFGEML